MIRNLAQSMRQHSSATENRLNRRSLLQRTGAVAIASSMVTAAPHFGRSAVAQDGITLNLCVSSDYEPIIESFAGAYEESTGNTINITSQAYNQTHDKIVSGLAGGGASYDIVAVDVVWTAEFAAAGFIAPLDDWIAQDLQDQLVQAALVSRSYDGSIYQWPLFTMKFLYYNQSMLEGAGFESPPATWEEFATMSQAMSDEGVAEYSTAWAMAQAEGLICDYVMLVEAFGGELQDDDGNWILNQGGAITALEYMAGSVEDGGFAHPASTTLDDRTNRNLFASGEVPFLLNWTSAYAQFTDEESSEVVDDVRIGLVPGTEQTGVASASCTGGSGFGIAAASPNKDAAWEFIQLAHANEDAQQRWLAEANQIPTLSDLYENESIIEEYPQFEQMRAQMDYGVGRPELPWYGQWTQIMQLELHRALVGEKSAQEAMDDAVEQLNAVQEQFS